MINYNSENKYSMQNFGSVKISDFLSVKNSSLIAPVNQGFKEIRFVVERIGFLMTIYSSIKKRKTLITFC